MLTLDAQDPHCGIDPPTLSSYLHTSATVKTSNSHKTNKRNIVSKAGNAAQFTQHAQGPAGFPSLPSFFFPPTMGLCTGLMHTVPALYHLACFPALLIILILRQVSLSFPVWPWTYCAAIELKGY